MSYGRNEAYAANNGGTEEKIPTLVFLLKQMEISMGDLEAKASRVSSSLDRLEGLGQDKNVVGEETPMPSGALQRLTILTKKMQQLNDRFDVSARRFEELI